MAVKMPCASEERQEAQKKQAGETENGNLSKDGQDGSGSPSGNPSGHEESDKEPKRSKASKANSNDDDPSDDPSDPGDDGGRDGSWKPVKKRK